MKQRERGNWSFAELMYRPRDYFYHRKSQDCEGNGILSRLIAVISMRIELSEARLNEFDRQVDEDREFRKRG